MSEKSELSRRDFLKLMSSAAAMSVLAACAPKAAEEPPAEEPVEEAPAEAPAEETIKLLLWSHWAEQENKKQTIMAVTDAYMEQNPNVEVEIVWWQKADMWPAMQSAFTSGEGFPDMFYYDSGKPEFIEAGWVANLSEVGFDIDRLTPKGQVSWTYTGPNGEGVYCMAIEGGTDLIYINPDAFEEAGVAIPDDFFFTTDQFLDACTKIRASGRDPFCEGIGDRPSPGRYIYTFLTMSKLGGEGHQKLWSGETSWDSPEAREILEYADELMQVPVNPATYTTMTLAESHRYFHTEQRGAMFLVGSWYTGRAFVPPEEGGQPEDFRLSWIKYPVFTDGKGKNQIISQTGAGFAAAAMSPNLEYAVAWMNLFAQEEFSNLWLSNTGIPSDVKTNSATMPDTGIKWYFEEWERVLGDADYQLFKVDWCGELEDAYTSVINEGLNQRLISVDEAITQLEEARKCGA